MSKETRWNCVLMPAVSRRASFFLFVVFASGWTTDRSIGRGESFWLTTGNSRADHLLRGHVSKARRGRWPTNPPCIRIRPTTSGDARTIGDDFGSEFSEEARTASRIRKAVKPSFVANSRKAARQKGAVPEQSCPHQIGDSRLPWVAQRQR